MARFWHRIYCERRRVGLVTALAFLAGYILYARVDMSVLGVNLPVLTGLLYAAFVGPAALATFLFMPALRLLTEAVALSRLGFACFVYCVPDPGLTLASLPLVNASLVIGGALALCWLGRRLARSDARAILPQALQFVLATGDSVIFWLHDTEARRSATGRNPAYARSA